MAAVTVAAPGEDPVRVLTSTDVSVLLIFEVVADEADKVVVVEFVEVL